MLEEWKWRDAMSTPAEKQRFLEPLIAQVRRDPERNEARLIFLLLVCEGIRRSVASELLAARAGLEGKDAMPARHRREEARRVDEIERERLFAVTRQATLEALYRYPSPPPEKFFGWLRETVAHRTLDFLREEFSQIETKLRDEEEGEAIQAILAGLEGVDAPRLADTGHCGRWRMRVRHLYEPVEAYWRLAEVRLVCRSAVDRLPTRQREVIEGYFYDGKETEAIAHDCRIKKSTVYNTRAQALGNLYRDDGFFMALADLRLVRDVVRRRQLQARYPDGRLPDGRRIVRIEEAA